MPSAEVTIREYLNDCARRLAADAPDSPSWDEWVAQGRPLGVRGDYLLAWEEIQDWSRDSRKRLSKAALPVIDLYAERYDVYGIDTSMTKMWVGGEKFDPRKMHMDAHALAEEAAGSLKDSELLHWSAHKMEGSAYVKLAASNAAHAEAHITLRPAQAVALCIKAAHQAAPEGRLAGLKNAEKETAQIIAKELGLA